MPSILWWVKMTNYYNSSTYLATYEIIIIVAQIEIIVLIIIIIIILIIDNNCTCWSISADRFILYFRVTYVKLMPTYFKLPQHLSVKQYYIIALSIRYDRKQLP